MLPNILQKPNTASLFGGIKPVSTDMPESDKQFVHNTMQNKAVQAPKATQAPQVSSGAKTFFSDEQSVYDRMINDGLDDTMARKLITKKRKSQLGEISQQEAKVLKNMIADGLDSETAVKVVKQNRNDNLPLWKKALKVPFNTTVGALSLGTEQTGNLLDFATGGQVPYFKEIVDSGKQITDRSFKGETGFQAGRNILGAGEIITTGPTQIGKTMSARVAQGAKYGAGFGAGDQILDKGADVTPGEIAKGAAVGGTLGAVGVPVVEKVVAPVAGKIIQKGAKYGTAGVKGGIKGAAKSVARDVKKPITEIKTKGVAPEKAYKLSTKANRFNAKDIEDFKKITGESPGEFAVKRGMTKVGDDAVDEATLLFQKSYKEADKGMDAIKGTFKIDKGDDYLGVMLDDLSSRMKNTLSKDTSLVEGLAKQYKEGGLTMSEINKIKRLYSKNFKYNWMEAASESAVKSKNLQDGLREWQFKVAKEQGFDNLSKINKNTQAWKTFSDNLAKKLNRSSGNNNISLTDWVALSGGEPTNLALFLGKKAGASAKVQSTLIKGLGKQTKKAIDTANTGKIIKTNLKKNATANISSNRSNTLIPNTKLKLKVIPKKVIKKPNLKKEIEGISKNKKNSFPKKLQGIDKMNEKEIVKKIDSIGIEEQNEIFFDYPNIEKLYKDSLNKLRISKLPKIGQTETGKPVKGEVYFGRNKNYNNISGSESNKGSGTGVGRGHIFFSSDNEIAKTYGKYVKKAELDINNPLVIDADGMDWTDIKYKGTSSDINKLAIKAESEGYDALIVNNVRDNGPLSNNPSGFKQSTTVAIFDASKAKIKK